VTLVPFGMAPAGIDVLNDPRRRLGLSPLAGPDEVWRAVWAAVKGYLGAVGDATAAPVIEKYTGVLAAADVFTPDVAFWLMESIRLNRGYGLQLHP
jgi:hypothetical protein